MTLKEMAIEYEKSGQLLCARLKELRQREKKETDEEVRRMIHRRIRDLEPLYTDVRKIAEILRNYYKEEVPNEQKE